MKRTNMSLPQAMHASVALAPKKQGGAPTNQCVDFRRQCPNCIYAIITLLTQT